MTKWNFKEMGTGLDHVVALVDVTESVATTVLFVCIFLCVCVCARVGVSDIRELLQKFQRDDHVEKLIKDLTFLQGGDLEEDVDQETDMMLGSAWDGARGSVWQCLCLCGSVFWLAYVQYVIVFLKVCMQHLNIPVIFMAISPVNDAETN
jgi:hypothetical protein